MVKATQETWEPQATQNSNSQNTFIELQDLGFQVKSFRNPSQALFTFWPQTTTESSSSTPCIPATQNNQIQLRCPYVPATQNKQILRRHLLHSSNTQQSNPAQATLACEQRKTIKFSSGTQCIQTAQNNQVPSSGGSGRLWKTECWRWLHDGLLCFLFWHARR